MTGLLFKGSFGLELLAKNRGIHSVWQSHHQGSLAKKKWETRGPSPGAPTDQFIDGH